MYKIRLGKLGLKLVGNRKNCGSINSDEALSVTVGFVSTWGVRKGNREERRGLSREIQIRAEGHGPVA